MNGKMNIPSTSIKDAVLRISMALESKKDYLTELDQALGDGDLGVTASKISGVLREYADSSLDDIGKYFASVDMAINRAAPSTLGTLFATGLMRAGKELRGLTEIDMPDLVTLITAADQGIQERGKARLGDKTIVDALHPAAEALKNAINAGTGLKGSGELMLSAAVNGLETVTPLQSRVGRSGWIGERTKGIVDPGCAFLVIVLEAILGKEAR